MTLSGDAGIRTETMTNATAADAHRRAASTRKTQARDNALVATLSINAHLATARQPRISTIIAQARENDAGAGGERRTWQPNEQGDAAQTSGHIWRRHDACYKHTCLCRADNGMTAYAADIPAAISAMTKHSSQ